MTSKALTEKVKHTPTPETMRILLSDYRRAYLKKPRETLDSGFNRLDDHNAIVQACNAYEEMLSTLKYIKAGGNNMHFVDKAIAKAEI